MIRHLDLFSGIGGFSYAAQQVWGEEYECVGFCEIDKYCQMLLKTRFPGVKIYDDIRNLRRKRFTADTNGDESKSDKRADKGKTKEVRGRKESDVSSGRFELDLLTGGFPCQPFSQAGKRKGKEDDRYLWPEMLRVIEEFKPRWIVGENVAGITNMAQPESDIEVEGEADNEEDSNQCGDADGVLWEIIESLKQIGYTVQIFTIPACAVGAPHRRDRIWIVAHSEDVWVRGKHGNDQQEEGKNRSGLSKCVCRDKRSSPEEATHSNANRSIGGNTHKTNKSGGMGPCGVARKTGNDTNSEQPRWTHRGPGQEREEGPRKCGDSSSEQHGWERNWLEVATELCGVDDGLPAKLDGFELSKSKHRVERLKALGNAIVPQVVMQIFEAIKRIDNG